MAGIAAAARDGVGVLGVAPEATILALKVSGPNLDGVSPGSGPVPEGESPNAALIAPAIRYALDKGAFVLNFSGNGVATGQIAADQRAAMDAVRTADRLLVESVSNFTGEDSFTGQIAQNLVGADQANRDWFLFAIGLTENGTPRTANGNAGPLADRMLAAGGVNVRTVDKDGSIVVETGNSFAAPAVAGAAALLKQYWPQLGGRAISRILLDTATDAGAPGVDQVYGVGVLNVEKAMQAQAPTSAFAAASAVLARFSSLSVPSAFGGSATASAIASRVGGMTVFDQYGRDYRMQDAAGIRSSGSALLSGLPVALAAPGFGGWSADRRLGLTSDNVGPWKDRGTTSRPALVAFSPAPGQTVTLGANVGIGPTAGHGGLGAARTGLDPGRLIRCLDRPRLAGRTRLRRYARWACGDAHGLVRDAAGARVRACRHGRARTGARPARRRLARHRRCQDDPGDGDRDARRRGCRALGARHRLDDARRCRPRPDPVRR